MPDTWVICAESSRARIFTVKNINDPPDEIATLVNPAGRMHERDLVSDRPGRTFDSRGAGRHGKEGPTGIHEQQAIRFARRISEYLEKNSDQFSKLILIAAPAFLGLLRDSINKEIMHKVTREIDKNVVRMEVDKIHKLLTG